MNIGNKIKKYRKEKKITQKEISNILGINIRTYQKYESGDIKPNIDTISRISFVLDVPIFMLTEDKRVIDLFAGTDGLNSKSKMMSKLWELSETANIEQEQELNIETLEEIVNGFKELEISFNKFKNDYIVGIEKLINVHKEGEQDGK
jgi:transcriptional regulator with XRE-family HTH domain